MGGVAIRVDGLGKRYRLQPQRGYETLGESLARSAAHVMRAPASLFRSRQPAPRRDDSHFWALRDVSFTVDQGQIVGVIGGNGAGKSTLLKILSRITSPTTGRAEVRGRLGSLLEVGAGFHPELTGRQNITLSGVILGMRHAEIQRKFDAIVDFAEVERFIDMPVKRYSSGMYLRLAFAVAAHLDPEILLVDEVLAVGDAAFQKRCLGKMGDVARQGRTILFVSHNLEAIQRLCSRGALLENGRLAAWGSVAAVVSRYLSQGDVRPAPGVRVDLSSRTRVGTGEARFTAVQYSGGTQLVARPACSMGPLEFLLEIESDARRLVGSLAVFLTDSYARKLINADTVLIERAVQLRPGRNLVKLRIAAVYLTPGAYRVGLWLADPIRGRSARGSYDSLDFAFEIDVVNPTSRASSFEPNAVVMCDFDVEEQP
jgi:lipopolysaccharide transport system ATP-binding protein